MPITYQISKKFAKSSKVFSTKHECEDFMQGFRTSYWSEGRGAHTSRYFSYGKPVIYLYHLEKHRKKVLVGVKKGCKPNRKVISKAFWKLTEYVVPIENIVEARQYERHFKLVLKA